MYSDAVEVLLAGHVQATVPAAGARHSVRAVIIATFGIHDFEIASCVDAGDRLRRQHFDAETLGVLPHLACELSALDAQISLWGWNHAGCSQGHKSLTE